MGRTLATTFAGWEKDHIAQLYFSDEQPESTMCANFYKVSDTDVLKSVLARRSYGSRVDCSPTIERRSTPSKVSSVKKAMTKIVRYRTPLIGSIRNSLWKIGVWDSVELHEWLDEFNPEVVYFASGGYAFSYRVALNLASTRKIPLVIGCYDDFYIGTKKTANPIYWLHRNTLLNTANRIFRYAHCFTAVCDKMRVDYEALFKKKGYTLYTSTELRPQSVKVEPRIVYTGNLSYGRAEQLMAIGRTLLKISAPDVPKHIDVYSAEIRTAITDKLNAQNGIQFHGKIPYDEVTQIIQSSSLVIHTESFDPLFLQRVAYSVSTKIADYLASGTCILAYGPSNVASMAYLRENNAAVVVTRSDDLEVAIVRALTDKTLRSNITENAKALAATNHCSRINDRKIYALFHEECAHENTSD